MSRGHETDLYLEGEGELSPQTLDDLQRQLGEFQIANPVKYRADTDISDGARRFFLFVTDTISLGGGMEEKEYFDQVAAALRKLPELADRDKVRIKMQMTCLDREPDYSFGDEE